MFWGWGWVGLLQWLTFIFLLVLSNCWGHFGQWILLQAANNRHKVLVRFSATTVDFVHGSDEPLAVAFSTETVNLGWILWLFISVLTRTRRDCDVFVSWYIFIYICTPAFVTLIHRGAWFLFTEIPNEVVQKKKKKDSSTLTGWLQNMIHQKTGTTVGRLSGLTDVLLGKSGPSCVQETQGKLAIKYISHYFC